MQGKIAEAEGIYRSMLRIDPQNEPALAGLAALSRAAREAEQLVQANASLKSGDTKAALRTVKEILTENPGQVEAQKLALGIEIEQNRGLIADPILSDALMKPVS